MGTLWSELGPVADEGAVGPRVYADANVPAGIVTFMRDSLRWDVLFVMEHADLRRARDIEHYRLARQLRRTLITLDRDYLDDRRFPPRETAGVLVISAPNERGLEALLGRIHASCSTVVTGTARSCRSHSKGPSCRFFLSTGSRDRDDRRHRSHKRRRPRGGGRCRRPRAGALGANRGRSRHGRGRPRSAESVPRPRERRPFGGRRGHGESRRASSGAGRPRSWPTRFPAPS